MGEYSADRLSLSLEMVRECIARKGYRAYPMVIAAVRATLGGT